MMTENEFKELVAENLIYYRKANNLTQIQLAEKLNYSDKSISKWERGESLPDLYILANIANLYGITLNDLVSTKKVKSAPKRKINHLLISLMACGLVWLLATLVYVLLGIFLPLFTKSWLTFIYAIPISMIVLLVFSKLWGNRIQVFLTLTILYWSIPLALLLSFDYSNLWLLFIAIIPLQILTVLWFILKKHNYINK